jgi:hypothetical protein
MTEERASITEHTVACSSYLSFSNHLPLNASDMNVTLVASLSS